jgi:uridine kinase
MARLAETIDQLSPGRRVIVAIDGPDTAGKTSLADALEGLVIRPTVRVSIDTWHNPREIRLRRGAESPDGYYLDSFDYDALVSECLMPFTSGADRIRTAGFDYKADQAVPVHKQVAPDAAVLLDGVFLLRPKLRSFWDFSVYLDVPESVTLARAVERDLREYGTEAELRQRYERRYLPGQRLYRHEATPLERAAVSVDNSDPTDPVVLRWPAVG